MLHQRLRSAPLTAIVAATFALFAGAASQGCGAGTGTSGDPTGQAGASTSSGTGGSSATSSSGSTSSNGSSGTGAGPMGCTTNNDCANNPSGKVCDPSTGACVGCTATSNSCAQGEFCDLVTNTCKTGCSSDADCANDPNGYLHCETQSSSCVPCLNDAHCAAGTLCSAADGYVCVPGCTPSHDCPSGLQCCSGQCHDVTTDFEHCGMCDKPCANPPHAEVSCVNGMCGGLTCVAPYVNCDGSSINGCEQNTLVDGPCLCVPGATQSCYQAPASTLNVGPCKAGTQTCLPSGTGWGPCMGQVLPKSEICANNIDEDCNGVLDDAPDYDGDGWTACNGDCCDGPLTGCTKPSPKLINPGAFEVAADGIDNDCDGTIDNVLGTCSSVADFSAVTAAQMAQAMDICQTTTANPSLPQKKWGLITSLQLHANGSVFSAIDLTNVQGFQNAVLTGYGTSAGNNPKRGSTMAGMSTGRMRDKGDAGYIAPNSGTDFVREIPFSPLPPVNTPIGFYLANNGNALEPGQCGAATCPTGDSANDSVDLRLSIRVPTNAQSFSYDFKFFTSEYQIYQCTQFNDYFLAMLTSGAAGIPSDHNISFDANNNPVSVNNGFFQICPGNGKNCGPCPNGTADLAGTGMEDASTGGATTWLTTDAPVVPGETMVIELILMDVSDGILDSVILMDNFRWNVQPAQVNTHQ